MQSRQLIWRVCAVAIILAMAGCAGHRAAKEPEMPLPPGISAAPGGLKFSVKITPTRFKRGAHVKLEATMFNDSDKKFEKTFPTACAWDYEIAQNARVLGPSRMCAQAETEIVLEPGELRMIVREWGGNDRYFDANQALAPGTYQVTAGLIEDGRVVPMADPVTIEILP
jgi:Intracellular proteinase inhibitor